MTHPKEAIILVIEDDEAVGRTVADMLELNGYAYELEFNGREGLEAARRLRPAVIVTDIEMPGLTGFELLQEIRADETLRNLPVIMITAKADRGAARRSMDLGADDYITKPFTEDELVRSIRTRLERKELIDELDAFAHTVAHDLKNPLATLIGRLGLLEMTLEASDPKVLRKDVSEALHAAGQLGNIIDEMLLLTGVRRARIKPQPLDMAALVAEARARLEHVIVTSGATVVGGESWPVVSGHGPWVTHIWTNYLANAAKYAGPSAHITLGGEVRPDGRHARFWVADRGPGLDAAAQKRLLTPFAHVSTAHTKGHGLGLSIVRRIVDRLGGSVGVESAPGAGARFWFELPLASPS